MEKNAVTLQLFTVSVEDFYTSTKYVFYIEDCN